MSLDTYLRWLPDWLPAGVTAEAIISEFPTVTVASVCAAAAYGAALAREELLALVLSSAGAGSRRPLLVRYGRDAIGHEHRVIGQHR